MLTPLLVYQLVVTAFLLALLGIVAVNLIVLPRITRYPTSVEDAPSVAVLVPARNEEENIEACLSTLLAQTYPNMAVWLYDDASTDRTREIAARVAANSEERLHVVEGKDDPPPGWLGKANACYRLYAAMREGCAPDYVLFTDADVQFEPGAVGHAVACAQAQNAGLFSIFPMQITSSWAERLAVPILLHWAVYTFLPLPLAHSARTGPAFAAANGQFMLFKREAYEAFGGHAAVRAQILEDVALARATKAAGYRAILADGGSLIRTRMYRGAREVWEGYSKNAFAFFGYSPLFLAMGILVLVALYIAPLAFALYAVVTGRFADLVLPAAQYLLAVLPRLLLAHRFGYRWLDAFLHPMSISYMIAIELNSMRWALTGRSAWKGRSVGTRG